MKPLVPTLSLMVTYQCNIECRHCGPSCGPRETDWMSLDEMRDLIIQAGELGARNVVFTGGEPTLLGDDLITLLKFIRTETPIGSTRLVTNGKWAVTAGLARKRLAAWRAAGLDEINISCGEFHQEHVPLGNVVNAYRAARELDYSTVLLAGEFLAPGRGSFPPERFQAAIGEPLLPPELASPYVSRTCGMSRGAALSYGRGARLLPEEDLHHRDAAEIPGLCSDVLEAITLHPDGNTTACCGVMVRDESLLNIGNWRGQRLRPMLEAAQQDLILNWIRYLGLKDMQAWLKEKDPGLILPRTYVSICDLCAGLIRRQRSRELLFREGDERRADILINRVALEATLEDPWRLSLSESAGESSTS